MVLPFASFQTFISVFREYVALSQQKQSGQAGRFSRHGVKTVLQALWFPHETDGPRQEAVLLVERPHFMIAPSNFDHSGLRPHAVIELA